MGETKRELRIRRIFEHKSSIRKRSTVARRFYSAGHGVCRSVGVEAVRPLLRGGDRERNLLQREAY